VGWRAFLRSSKGTRKTSDDKQEELANTQKDSYYSPELISTTLVGSEKKGSRRVIMGMSKRGKWGREGIH